MDMQRLRAGVLPSTANIMQLPEYIISSFFPAAQPLLAQYPLLFKFLGVLLALYYFGPIARFQALWNQFSSLLLSTVTVNSDEDLFGYLVSYIAGRRTLRADQTLNAISNPPQGSSNRIRGSRDPLEENPGKRHEEVKIKYEQSQGMQLFIHKKRLFFIKRTFTEGHTYVNNRYKRLEILSLSCLGRSTQPIKDLMEHVYLMNKNKERSLTIIRRPYTGGMASRLNWSRLTSKPRRALDTVILDTDQKEKVIADMEEYMDEATQQFYGNHGIPYRRGYLFHGPPGVGKSSFSLALASKFNLDVYVLTLLDHDLTDSDLISLMNQLPSRSLLLLEDIDTAGLSRKSKPRTTARTLRRQYPGMPAGAIATMVGQSTEADDEEDSGTTSRVTLSGLLNAIDGVAAPEGHILIMTTNKPHELDDALVRAGRVSVRVEFKNASKLQAEEIFRRMYVDLPQASKTSSSSAPSSNAPLMTDEHLSSLAKKFSSIIPEYEFSPADLQDYLLVYKRSPVQAVERLPAWMEEKREEKKQKEEEKSADLESQRHKRPDERRQKMNEIRNTTSETKSADEVSKVAEGTDADFHDALTKFVSGDVRQEDDQKSAEIGQADSKTMSTAGSKEGKPETKEG